MTIPIYVQTVLDTFNTAGYEAYAVGGCIRDMLLGKIPADWDVCTSALPHETEALFSHLHTIPTGIKHGTVTVISGGHHIEVTTFRIDGEYSDNRRPDTVTFTPDIKRDLARRDFTVNAMAYSPHHGLIDPFDGRSDLENGLIRAVGEPEKRFREDALRIMRALRFAAVYGFQIDSETANALDECKNLLSGIAVERIATELNKLLIAPYCTKILREYSRIISQFLPEISDAIGYCQNNPHHIYDLWEHTLHGIENSPPKLSVRLALLFHDLAKPRCVANHPGGFTYFPNHPEKSSELAANALARLKYDNKTKYTVKRLIKNHDAPIPDRVSVKKMLHHIGSENFRLLLDVKLADNIAKAPGRTVHYDETRRAEKIFDEIMSSGECFSLKKLAVDGNILINERNVSGTDVGEALEYLLTLVIEEKCENEKNALLRAFDEYKNEL